MSEQMGHGGLTAIVIVMVTVQPYELVEFRQSRLPPIQGHFLSRP